MEKANLLDCKQGRCLGCQTYCCRLIVRLTEHEAARIYPENPEKLSLDKNLDTGFCEFMDGESFSCTIFEKRPAICREYNCNEDKLLQVALKQKVDSISSLSSEATKPYIPRDSWKTVPRIGESPTSHSQG